MDVGTVIVGAGVIGLAVARKLSAMGEDVILIEAEDAIGFHTSSRNSEVVHAGLYYDPGSLKARLCVSGRRDLYEYCRNRNVPTSRIGKLIAATSDSQIPRLENLFQRGKINGVDDLIWLSGEEARRLEPELVCRTAVFSPSSGIVDSHALMLALQGDAEAHGAQCAFRTKVTGVSRVNDGFEVRTSGAEDASLLCGALINCAGLGAQELAANIEGYPPDRIPQRHLAKGNYFSVSGATPFTHLVYPMPVDGGLGVHVTLDLAGRMRLGPDLQWIDEIDYTPDDRQAGAFYEAVKPFWPGIANREISASYCGIRPKITGPGGGAADFRIDGPDEHGIAGLVSLYGVESPGLTSSLALADHVVEKLRRR